MGIFYQTYYQGGDTFFYFNAASEFNRSANNGLIQYILSFGREIPGLDWQPRTQFFIKLISPVLLFCRDYWLLSLYLSLISFAGCWYFVRRATNAFPDLKIPVYYAFLFFPSVVFWSSGVLKDNLANTSLLVLLGVILGYFWGQKTKWQEWVVLVFVTIVLVNLRFYAGGLIIVFISILLISKSLKVNSYYKLGIYAILIVVGIVGMKYLHPYMSLDRLPLTIFENHQTIAAKSSEQNLIQFSTLEPTYTSIVQNFPMAILSGLFRPLLWEHGEWISLGIRLENLTLIFLAIVSLFHIRLEHFNTLIISSFILILVLSGFLTLTTPNFGTLSRYKSIFLPHFVLLISILPFRKIVARKHTT